MGPRKKPAALRGKTAVLAADDHVTLISSEEESAEPKGYCCYVLRSSTRNRTYTGITTDLSRRLRQHNGELHGGAKATRTGGLWKVLCVVRGFPTKLDAERFEWRAKRRPAVNSRKLLPVQGGLQLRCMNLQEVLSLERWTRKSRPAAEMPLQVTWFGGAPPRALELPPHISERLEGEFEPQKPKRKQRKRKREPKAGAFPCRKNRT
ncbi:unnamed protein product [Effrenium voratum]|nr:unnamed protein product [Effrenium voratum]